MSTLNLLYMYVSTERIWSMQVYPHFTCATSCTDTTVNIWFVFDAVTDTVIRKQLRDPGVF